jgi:ZIP family zinc transporter
MLEIIIPLIGTVLGSACVFLVKGKMNRNIERAFTGFAAGVMVAASVFSLIIPAYDSSSSMGIWAFIPVVVGVSLGFLFLMLLDKIIPHLHMNSEKSEGPKSKLSRSTMMILAVALHNLPEGMAVGVVLAGMNNSVTDISVTMALALAIGIAIQNFPEGAIISVPLHNNGTSKWKSFLLGALSGVVEPLGAVLTLALASVFTPVLPYLLCFAAGAMLYVVVEELIPEMSEGKHSNIGTIFFAVGFTVMMILDVALG